ncbi:zinc ABC transporter substrate-binding protein AztC [Aeromicrobium piscarium]|uniref:Zinc ABC transporter substrate-binding protein n=1 Tax=Aeromicrobium piscarium TaxID=2590901 RepID=A0A554S842_9ACTN|nr:zinc ABC transporter substrate-binding protein [Aeromicrobium piscarium]
MVTRRLAALAGGIALSAAALTACSGGPSDGGVVVTTNILGDVVQEVAGDDVEVTVLMPAGADPHSFEISAQQAAAVENADLVVSNGLGLEEGVQHVVDAAEADGVPVLAVGDLVDPLEYREGASAGQLDPHFWTDPARMNLAVEHVTEALEEHAGIEPGEGAVAYLDELTDLDRHMREAFDAIPDDRRSLVTNHHVLGYLADRYDFEVVGAVIPSGTTLASPSAADLDSLATAITENGVPAVFADSSQPDRLAQVLADTAGIDVQVVSLYSESLTADGEAATYLGMMRANTDAIASALS